MFSPTLTPDLFWTIIKTSAVLATGFYGLVIGGITQFTRYEKYRVPLAQWLRGQHQDTWANQFCIMFDSLFGKQHLSWKCFRRSAVASLLTVAILYLAMQLHDLLGNDSRTQQPWHSLRTRHRRRQGRKQNHGTVP